MTAVQKKSKRVRVPNFDWTLQEKLMFVRMAWDGNLFGKANTGYAAKQVTNYLDALGRLPYPGYEFPREALYAWRKEVLAEALMCQETREKIFQKVS